MSTPALDQSTLAAQLKVLAINHEDLQRSLQQREQQLVTLKDEIQQYRGALSYSKHVQDQMTIALQQVVAAEHAAKLSADSAAASATQSPTT